METASKRKQNERPVLRPFDPPKARFCPFLYFKVPKRTRRRFFSNLNGLYILSDSYTVV